MKKLITFAQLFFICCLPGFTQEQSQEDKETQNLSVQGENRIIPSSPTVLELGKYGQVPVSHSTGVPNISIPIYTIECGQLSLPITLSYHASGIKVDQLSSWVGLGWSLNAGGVITSTAMGKSDMSQQPTDISGLVADFNNPMKDIFTLETVKQITNLQKNTQPDIYSYNFLNYSGMFFLEAVNPSQWIAYDVKNNKEIKITCENPIGGASYFQVTDNRGVVYKFEKIEKTIKHFYKGYCTFNNSYRGKGTLTWSLGDHIERGADTGWFLTSITSADGIDQIKLEYEEETYSYDTRPEGKLVYAPSGYPGGWVGHDHEGGNVLKIGDTFSKSVIEHQTYRLKGIKAYSKRQEIIGVTFDVSDTYIVNLQGSYPLKKISIVNLSTESETLIKQWDFENNYFISSNMSGRQRLRLLSVTEDGYKKYKFDYYGDIDQESHMRMPSRLSYCGYDHWGYLNDNIAEGDESDVRKLFSKDMSIPYGVSQNSYLSGSVSSVSIDGPLRCSAGSKKYPDERYAKAHTLKAVHYPSGGYSVFDYELHDYLRLESRNPYRVSNQLFGGLRIKSIENWDNNELKEKKTYSYRQEWDPDASSGSAINDSVEYYRRKSVSFSDINGLTTHTSTLEISTSAYNFKHSFKGDYIIYSEVVESDGNGFKRYTFDTETSGGQGDTDYNLLWYGDRTGSSLNIKNPEYTQNIGSAPYYASSFSGYWGESHRRGLLTSIDTYNISGE